MDKLEEKSTQPTISKNQNRESDNTKYALEVPIDKDIISRLIRALREFRNYSQTRFGRMLGVQKAQISKLEKGNSNITIGTILKVFKALKANVYFTIKFENKEDIKVLKEIIKEENGSSDNIISN